MTDLEHPTPSSSHYDLIIVGSGSGNSIPEPFSEWSIAMVERGTFGGTCLNVGCIPSKMFVLPADRAVQARRSALNLSTSYDGVDWQALRDRIFGRIDAISDGGEHYRAAGTPGLALYRGTARFVADRTFSVAMNDGSPAQTISADRVLLAAGSRPVVPDIPGLSEVRYHTSDTIMRLDELPSRIGILGGGFIATEMGHVFSGFGSDVTLFTRSGSLLRSHDHEIAARFTEVFDGRVNLELENIPTEIRAAGDAIEIVHRGGTASVVVDELLVATGRIGNADMLDVTIGGLEATDQGRIKTDAQMRTAVPGVWAVGDITNDLQLKHLANAEAKVAFANISASRSSEPGHALVDYSAVPSAVFSHPQVASVGLTETEAIDRGLEYVVGRRDYAGTAYGWALDDHESFAKVLLALDGSILGAHIIGPQAASLLQPLIQAMATKQTADQIANDVFYIHPALTEVVENALLDGLNQLVSNRPER